MEIRYLIEKFGEPSPMYIQKYEPGYIFITSNAWDAIYFQTAFEANTFILEHQIENFIAVEHGFYND